MFAEKIIREWRTRAMILEIETDAAAVLLKVLLSCQCAISNEAENEIAHYITSQMDKPSIDFKRIIDIAGGPDADTVFRRLRDCCFYSRSSLDEVVITKDDVYRHFCSAYHWKIAEDALQLIPQNANNPISNIPSWFIGHMLLPVKLIGEKDSIKAEYAGLGFRIQILNIFVPSDIEIQKGAIYAIHFASVISDINFAQYIIISQLLESVYRFVEFRKEVKVIDYADFQKYGNYSNLCKSRYGKYYQ
ncbi:MAG: hypothetical protein ACQCN4_00175 [Candidatus Bathyarchaeia archaeon]